jgi:putative SOS response-associated peptidase YedK
MCVRYTFHEPDKAIAAVAKALAAKLAPLPEWAKPRFNVTLTHVMPVVAAGEGGPELRPIMWGLVPFYERKQAAAEDAPQRESRDRRHPRRVQGKRWPATMPRPGQRVLRVADGRAS